MVASQINALPPFLFIQLITLKRIIFGRHAVDIICKMSESSIGNRVGWYCTAIAAITIATIACATNLSNLQSASSMTSSQIRPEVKSVNVIGFSVFAKSNYKRLEDLPRVCSVLCSFVSNPFNVSLLVNSVLSKKRRRP